MCEPIVPPSNIKVEFERDAALRTTEVVIVNHDHEGNETMGIVIRCLDDGRVETRGPVKLIGEVRII